MQFQGILLTWIQVNVKLLEKKFEKLQDGPKVKLADTNFFILFIQIKFELKVDILLNKKKIIRYFAECNG